jgi:biotin synthase-like enzyme
MFTFDIFLDGSICIKSRGRAKEKCHYCPFSWDIRK